MDNQGSMKFFLLFPTPTDNIVKIRIQSKITVPLLCYSCSSTETETWRISEKEWTLSKHLSLLIPLPTSDDLHLTTHMIYHCSPTLSPLRFLPLPPFTLFVNLDGSNGARSTLLHSPSKINSAMAKPQLGAHAIPQQL